MIILWSGERASDKDGKLSRYLVVVADRTQGYQSDTRLVVLPDPITYEPEDDSYVAD